MVETPDPQMWRNAGGGVRRATESRRLSAGADTWPRHEEAGGCLKAPLCSYGAERDVRYHRSNSHCPPTVILCP